ncbi:MAG: hypothetical protein P8171_23210 [Candidatus Thiodiazotropha sp.]
MPHKNRKFLPVYQGLKWISPELPTEGEPWPLSNQNSAAKEKGQRRSSERLLREVLKEPAWQWPKRQIFFFSDLHADSDAFIASLVASVQVTKPTSLSEATVSIRDLAIYACYVSFII